MRNTEYSVHEINQVMDNMRRLYDIVRLVDAEECRVLSIDNDGHQHYGHECFAVWGASQRCANCSSYQACLTNTNRHKTEHYSGKHFQIQSVPIVLRQNSGELISCVMEMISISEGASSGKTARNTVDVDYEYLIDHDEMTHLYNVHALNKYIRSMLMENPDKTYMILSGNISGFKLVNSIFGREKGNSLLVGIADILRAECSEQCVYGRVREDHFVICMPKELYAESVIEQGVQRICALLDSPRFSLRMHIGVYEVTDHDIPVPVMIDRADIAQKTIQANSDRLIAYYTEEMLERQIRELKVISEFEKALQSDEFRIFLQPQVDVDGFPSGAEALVRWFLPDGKMAMPFDFIEILERSDLICKLDQRVWELAVAQLARWKGTPYERLHISINVSPKDFYYIDVPSVLKTLCGKYGVESRKLRVELTETALADDSCSPAVIVERLQSLGFHVEIDDFGKGYSSLSLVKDIRADTLKVDMEFIRETRNEDRSRIILQSIARMASDLGMQAIVEGVETREQVDWLSKSGYRQFQGFFFSKPVSIEAFMQKYAGVLGACNAQQSRHNC